METDPTRFAGWLLESMGSGVVGVDAQGRVAWLNGGARALLARGTALTEDAVGRHCGEVFRHQPTVARLLLEAAEGQGGLSRAELSLEGAGEASAATIGLTLFPVRDGTGAPAGAAMLFRDLAPIEHSAEQQALQGRLSALGQMAAGLAHELRNPLAAMELAVGLLRRQLEGQSRSELSLDDQRELVQDLQGQVRALTAVVNTSLDFVKPQVPQRVPTHAEALVDAALERVVPRFAQPPRIEKRFETALPPVAVDSEPLVVALSNLIANACQALEASGTPEPCIVLEIACAHCRGESPVRVGTADDLGDTAPPRELVIRVADNGPGVPPELREKIFYPFFTTREEGSGIGLATVQKVVASHGGTLALESPPGRGACFGVHLPLEPGGPA